MGRQLEVKVSLKNVHYTGPSIGRDLGLVALVGDESFLLSSKSKGPGKDIAYKGSPKEITVAEDRDGKYPLYIQAAVQEQDEKSRNCDHGSSDVKIGIIPFACEFEYSLDVVVTDKQMKGKPTATFTFKFLIKVLGDPR